MNNSLNPDTPIRLSAGKFISLVIAIAAFCFTIGGIGFSIANDINSIKNRLSNIEDTLEKVRDK